MLTKLKRYACLACPRSPRSHGPRYFGPIRPRSQLHQVPTWQEESFVIKLCYSSGGHQNQCLCVLNIMTSLPEIYLVLSWFDFSVREPRFPVPNNLSQLIRTSLTISQSLMPYVRSPSLTLEMTVPIWGGEDVKTGDRWVNLVMAWLSNAKM